MLHPFADESIDEKTEDLLVGETAAAEDRRELSSADIKDHSVFLQPIDLALRPHFSSASKLEDLLLSQNLPPQMVEAVERHRDRLSKSIEEIKKSFKIYISTAADEPLQREAMRLERRYFREGANESERNFLKMKRFYEKVRTFNQIAKREWREISKAIDTFMVMDATRSLAYEIESEHLKGILLLMRQTDSFLDDLRIHLQAEGENSDPITGSVKIQLKYNPDIIYTIPAALGVEEPSPSESQHQEGQETHDNEAETQPQKEDHEGSIALNIVLETREHKLNRASMISVPILGSRDWNRTPEYRFEVPLGYFEECVDQFKRAYHVNIKEDDIRNLTAVSAIGNSKGVGEEIIVDYKKLIVVELDEIARLILDDDFPGLAHPLVFLYHCGAHVFYSILLKILRKKGLGEMLFVDETHSTRKEFPEELIQKILIDWWRQYFSELSGEEVDSYLTYSRQIEMVRREYRILYDEGVQTVKKEIPGITYLKVERWIQENRDRVFGLRKVEIFRRFIKSPILE